MAVLKKKETMKAAAAEGRPRPSSGGRDRGGDDAAAAARDCGTTAKEEAGTTTRTTTVAVTLPVLSIALLIACSVSYLCGEAFRLAMPDHPVTKFASSVVPRLGGGSSSSSSLSSSRNDSSDRRRRSASGDVGGGGGGGHPQSPSDSRSDVRRSTVERQREVLERRRREKEEEKGGAGGHGGGGGRATKREEGKKQLPRPKLQRGKQVPETRYTSGGRVFEADDKGVLSAVRGSFDLHIDLDVGENDTCAERGAAVSDVSVAGAAEGAEEGARDGEGAEEEEHLPAGQHLLVDIKNVDGTFLNSEERLASAMVEVVNESALTLLSYHCHSLLPSGVSCVGILLESHISFHTWPVEGVITLDLFTCGPNPLLSVVKTVERLFAVPQPNAGTYQPLAGSASDPSYSPRAEDYVDLPRMVWSHVLRGFRPSLGPLRYRVLENDVSDHVLSRLELDHKAEVANLDTDYQHIGIYDVIHPRVSSLGSYERSVRPEFGDTYEGRNPELFRPDRRVFLDGAVQSTRRGDEAFHEALVHPGMFAHPNPRRAVIVGGGEGATLREVLKHRTVEHVKMIEIDELMVNVSRRHLPDWSDCSDLVGSEDSCFDDPRAELLCEDALAWFVERFRYPLCDCEEGGMLKEAEWRYCECEEEESSDDYEEEESSDDYEEEEDSSDDYEDEEGHYGDEERFDVILMDALDPQDLVDFADVLYSNELFLESLYGALTDDGVLVMKLGKSPSRFDPAEEMGKNENRASVMAMVEDIGFESMHIYEEAHCGFHDPWSFLVACKNAADCRWHGDEAALTAEIHRRIVRTKSGEPALKSFDGATMAGTYRAPPKAWEDVFCRRRGDPQRPGVRGDCSLYRGPGPGGATAAVVRANDVEVRRRSSGTAGGDVAAAGWGAFAKVDIPEGSVIMQEQATQRVRLDARTLWLMEWYHEEREEAEDLGDVLRYAYEYGFDATSEYYADSGCMAFVNHGCNGTSNVGKLPLGHRDDRYLNEAAVDPAARPFEVSSTFSPVQERHLPHVAARYDVALRDIRAGEELFQNYLFFVNGDEEWKRVVRDLRAQCRRASVGNITTQTTSRRGEL